MKKAKVLNTLSLIFNVIIVGAVVYGVILTQNIVGSLVYFTVLSNIILALAALVCIPFNIKAIVKGEKLAKGAVIFKFVGVVGTTIAFITAATLLSALDGWNIAGMLGFNNINSQYFFLHFAAPVAALISFIFFDKSKKIKYKAVTLGIIPLVLYGVFYVVNVFLSFVTAQTIGGGTSSDWYGLYTMVQGNPLMFALVAIGFALAGYIIAVLLWLTTKLLNSEEAVEAPIEAPAQEKAEEPVEEEPAKEEQKAEEPKAEEAPKAEEKVEEESSQEEELQEEEEPEEDAEVYIPVREEEEEKKPAKKAAKKEAPKAEEKKEAKAEEKVEEKKAQPAKKSAPAKKEEKPAPKKEEKKAAPVKKEAKPAPKAEEKKPAAKKEAPKAEAKEKPAPKKEAPKAEAKPAKVYHLTKRKEDGMWAITFVGGSKAVKLFKTKKEAEEALKVLTENQGATALIRNSKGAKAGKFASSIKAEEK